MAESDSDLAEGALRALRRYGIREPRLGCPAARPKPPAPRLWPVAADVPDAVRPWWECAVGIMPRRYVLTTEDWIQHRNTDYGLPPAKCDASDEHLRYVPKKRTLHCKPR